MIRFASTFAAAARGFTLGALALLASVPTLAAQSGGNLRAPELPAGCGALQPPAGNVVSYHVFAAGVQIYQWDATVNAWVFREPAALLFADAAHHWPVGVHYIGPTWMSLSGSQVVGRAVANCLPDPTAIPWLLLSAVSTQGLGPFTATTFIQRTNTAGGRAPARAGTANEVVAVPYTAEYWFYRAR